jgi:hypothetical protein
MVKIAKTTTAGRSPKMTIFYLKTLFPEVSGRALLSREAYCCGPLAAPRDFFWRCDHAKNHNSFGTGFLDRIGRHGPAFRVVVQRVGDRAGDKAYSTTRIMGKEGEAMRVKLAPGWALTTNHAASSYGRPVLLNEDNGNVYGPGDMVSCYPESGFMMAKHFVEEKALKLRLTEKQAQFIAKFLN